MAPSSCYIIGDEVSTCPERSPHTYTAQGGGQVAGEYWQYRGYEGPRPTKFYESPMSYQLVLAGQLPKLADRMPNTEDVLIVSPPDELGEYGGTFRLTSYYLFLGEFSLGSWYERDSDGVDWGPHIGKLVEHTDGGRTYRLTLRRNQKWDDGVPFTMDDIRFAWETLIPNKELHPSFATEFRDPITDVIADFVVIDDLTWELQYDTPNYNLFEQRANRGDHCSGGAGRGCFWSPKHYMGQFVPGIADPAALQKKIDDNKVEDWVQLWKLKTNWETNTEKPCMRAWCIKSNSDTQRTGSRNHYFWGVDPEGNQMPYMDEVTMIAMESREVAVFRAMAGENDGQTAIYASPEIPLYVSNMEKGDYSLYHWPLAAEFSIAWNQTYNHDPVIGELLRTKKFRHALSYATDRDELNGVVLDLGVPGQVSPHPTNPYYPGDSVVFYKINYDPAKANTMLDELGLTAKDSDGFRLRPDGSGDRISFKWQLGLGSGQGADTLGDITTFLIGQWAKVGIEMKQDRKASSHVDVRKGLEYLSSSGLGYGVNPWSVSTTLVPLAHSTHTMSEIGRWYETKGAEGEPKGANPAYLPLAPPANFPSDVSGGMEKAHNLYQEGRAYERLSPERISIAKQIFTINDEEMYQIGTLGHVGNFRGILLNRNTVRNQPITHFVDHYGYYSWSFYFEDGIDNANHPDNRSRRYTSQNLIGKSSPR